VALPDGQSLLLLHNPRCSKSRAAKSLLEERGARFALRLYLEDPLSRAELAELRRRLGRPAREWARRGEPAFSAAGLGPVSDDDAVLGRPPERVIDLL
jgi:arsenate reductase